ncbi:methyl-accepting chemotaxis protein, partial [Staphylococcus aureus]
MAAEVRTLATRCAAAAKEIDVLITTSVGQMESGSSLVSEANQQVHAAVASIEQVATLIAETTRSAKGQSAGLGEVARSV